jgi:hypothetical protein
VTCTLHDYAGVSLHEEKKEEGKINDWKMHYIDNNIQN